MAKNTKEGALQTEALVYQSIIEIFFQDGWDAVTYGAIAKYTGLSRSGIQRVVPSKDSMVDAFQGQVLDYVSGLIDASSPETIKASWLAGLEQEKFAHCVRFLLGSVYMETQAKNKIGNGVEILIDKYGEKVIIELIGLSALSLLGVETGKKKGLD
ncbi:TetR/AcrR family transcriptional regulator [Enterovibrio paralichthyis]|uniref:TetR/AcrR family transcriptional regulator n=1 Tax=Enterovibrio paralichthyis TaxID=2853805 RepID=UPI001C46A462|nr:TetR/AcrR family transcriptional regulator [Enterovibrio paralichthyis]MBV7299249.1 TetR/AcrR family transcriptional regulator [Enterovibrio paralichthyis]